jgi:hypothetical protein
VAEATRDGDEIVLRLSPHEAAVVQVLVGAAIPRPDSDPEMYGYASNIFHELEDHLHDPGVEDYWNRVYDALGGVFGYSFKKETDG